MHPATRSQWNCTMGSLFPASAAGIPANRTKIAMLCQQTMIGLRAEFQTGFSGRRDVFRIGAAGARERLSTACEKFRSRPVRRRSQM
jgi:hypothetical protein